MDPFAYLGSALIVIVIAIIILLGVIFGTGVFTGWLLWG